jgi:hypothetical protein
MPFSSKLISEDRHTHQRIDQFNFTHYENHYSLNQLNTQINTLQSELYKLGIKGYMSITLRTPETRFPFKTPIPITNKPIHLERLYVYYESLISPEHQFMEHPDLQVIQSMYVVVMQTNYS